MNTDNKNISLKDSSSSSAIQMDKNDSKVNTNEQNIIEQSNNKNNKLKKPPKKIKQIQEDIEESEDEFNVKPSKTAKIESIEEELEESEDEFANTKTPQFSNPTTSTYPKEQNLNDDDDIEEDDPSVFVKDDNNYFAQQFKKMVKSKFGNEEEDESNTNINVNYNNNNNNSNNNNNKPIIQSKYSRKSSSQSTYGDDTPKSNRITNKQLEKMAYSIQESILKNKTLHSDDKGKLYQLLDINLDNSLRSSLVKELFLRRQKSPHTDAIQNIVVGQVLDYSNAVSSITNYTQSSTEVYEFEDEDSEDDTEFRDIGKSQPKTGKSITKLQQLIDVDDNKNEKKVEHKEQQIISTAKIRKSIEINEPVTDITKSKKFKSLFASKPTKKDEKVETKPDEIKFTFDEEEKLKNQNQMDVESEDYEEDEDLKQEEIITADDIADIPIIDIPKKKEEDAILQNIQPKTEEIKIEEEKEEVKIEDEVGDIVNIVPEPDDKTASIQFLNGELQNRLNLLNVYNPKAFEAFEKCKGVKQLQNYIVENIDNANDISVKFDEIFSVLDLCDEEQITEYFVTHLIETYTVPNKSKNLMLAADIMIDQEMQRLAQNSLDRIIISKTLEEFQKLPKNHVVHLINEALDSNIFTVFDTNIYENLLVPNNSRTEVGVISSKLRERHVTINATTVRNLKMMFNIETTKLLSHQRYEEFFISNSLRYCNDWKARLGKKLYLQFKIISFYLMNVNVTSQCKIFLDIAQALDNLQTYEVEYNNEAIIHNLNSVFSDNGKLVVTDNIPRVEEDLNKFTYKDFVLKFDVKKEEEKPNYGGILKENTTDKKMDIHDSFAILKLIEKNDRYKALHMLNDVLNVPLFDLSLNITPMNDLYLDVKHTTLLPKNILYMMPYKKALDSIDPNINMVAEVLTIILRIQQISAVKKKYDMIKQCGFILHFYSIKEQIENINSINLYRKNVAYHNINYIKKEDQRKSDDAKRKFNQFIENKIGDYKKRIQTEKLTKTIDEISRKIQDKYKVITYKTLSKTMTDIISDDDMRNSIIGFYYIYAQEIDPDDVLYVTNLARNMVHKHDFRKRKIYNRYTIEIKIREKIKFGIVNRYLNYVNRDLNREIKKENYEKTEKLIEKLQKELEVEVNNYNLLKHDLVLLEAKISKQIDPQNVANSSKRRGIRFQASKKQKLDYEQNQEYVLAKKKLMAKMATINKQMDRRRLDLAQIRQEYSVMKRQLAASVTDVSDKIDKLSKNINNMLLQSLNFDYHQCLFNVISSKFISKNKDMKSVLNEIEPTQLHARELAKIEQEQSIKVKKIEKKRKKNVKGKMKKINILISLNDKGELELDKSISETFDKAKQAHDTKQKQEKDKKQKIKNNNQERSKSSNNNVNVNVKQLRLSNNIFTDSQVAVVYGQQIDDLHKFGYNQDATNIKQDFIQFSRSVNIRSLHAQYWFSVVDDPTSICTVEVEKDNKKYQIYVAKEFGDLTFDVFYNLFVINKEFLKKEKFQDSKNVQIQDNVKMNTLKHIYIRPKARGGNPMFGLESTYDKDANTDIVEATIEVPNSFSGNVKIQTGNDQLLKSASNVKASEKITPKQVYTVHVPKDSIIAKGDNINLINTQKIIIDKSPNATKQVGAITAYESNPIYDIKEDSVTTTCTLNEISWENQEDNNDVELTVAFKSKIAIRTHIATTNDNRDIIPPNLSIKELGLFNNALSQSMNTIIDYNKGGLELSNLRTLLTEMSSVYTPNARKPSMSCWLLCYKVATLYHIISWCAEIDRNVNLNQAINVVHTIYDRNNNLNLQIDQFLALTRLDNTITMYIDKNDLIDYVALTALLCGLGQIPIFIGNTVNSAQFPIHNALIIFAPFTTVVIPANYQFANLTQQRLSLYMRWLATKLGCVEQLSVMLHFVIICNARFKDLSATGLRNINQTAFECSYIYDIPRDNTSCMVFGGYMENFVSYYDNINALSMPYDTFLAHLCEITATVKTMYEAFRTARGITLGVQKAIYEYFDTKNFGLYLRYQQQPLAAAVKYYSHLYCTTIKMNDSIDIYNIDAININMVAHVLGFSIPYIVYSFLERQLYAVTLLPAKIDGSRIPLDQIPIAFQGQQLIGRNGVVLDCYGSVIFPMLVTQITNSKDYWNVSQIITQANINYNIGMGKASIAIANFMPAYIINLLYKLGLMNSITITRRSKTSLETKNLAPSTILVRVDNNNGYVQPGQVTSVNWADEDIYTYIIDFDDPTDLHIFGNERYFWLVQRILPNISRQLASYPLAQYPATGLHNDSYNRNINPMNIYRPRSRIQYNQPNNYVTNDDQMQNKANIVILTNEKLGHDKYGMIFKDHNINIVNIADNLTKDALLAKMNEEKTDVYVILVSGNSNAGKSIREVSDVLYKQKIEKDFLTKHNKANVKYYVGMKLEKGEAVIHDYEVSYALQLPEGSGSEFDNIFSVNNKTLGSQIGRNYYENNPKMRMLLTLIKKNKGK